MATEQVLAIGADDAESEDVTVATGDALTACLNGEEGDGIHNDARVDVQLKDSENRYFSIAKLTGLHSSCIIAGAGTYRFKRYAGKSCGVFTVDA